MTSRKLFAMACLALAVASGTASAATVTKDVDLVFVIDRSGSMSDEGATLSARIGEVLTGLSADAAIGSVKAGVVSFASSGLGTGESLVSAITDDVGALQSAINGISYGGWLEDGLGAMTAALPGGSLFGSLGWRGDTVKSLVLLTDEDDDAPAPDDYLSFQATLQSLGYLNNIIVSNDSSRCSAFPTGTSTGGGCEYADAANPTGAMFDLVDFTQNTDAFLADFISVKIGEIRVTEQTPINPVPLPAGGLLLVGAFATAAALRGRHART